MNSSCPTETIGSSVAWDINRTCVASALEDNLAVYSKQTSSGEVFASRSLDLHQFVSWLVSLKWRHSRVRKWGRLFFRAFAPCDISSIHSLLYLLYTYITVCLGSSWRLNTPWRAHQYQHIHIHSRGSCNKTSPPQWIKHCVTLRWNFPRRQ